MMIKTLFLSISLLFGAEWIKKMTSLNPWMTASLAVLFFLLALFWDKIMPAEFSTTINTFIDSHRIVARVSLVLVILALFGLWGFGAFDKDKDSQLKKPTFSENIKNFSFSLGERGISTGYSKDALKEPKEPFKLGGHVPVKLYIKNGNLFADVKVYGGSGLPPIEIIQNELQNKPYNWDSNSNDKALEVVDDKHNPVYQFFYKNPSHIVVNGIFPYPGGLILANNEGAIINPFLPATFKLKRIFKYPSYKYSGEYEE